MGREGYPAREAAPGCDLVQIWLERLRLHRGQRLQRVVDGLDELLGGPDRCRIARHRDRRLLQCAELLKASGRIEPAGDGGLHEALDELMRESFVEIREIRQRLDLRPLRASF